LFHLLIGHRGAGKSAFLRRLVSYYQDAGRPVVALDLDAELAERHHEPTSQLFERVGEAAFRDLEASKFSDLYLTHRPQAQCTDVFVALGAGFTFAPPDDVRILWIRRPTDPIGRVFLDRPRLDPGLGPIEEFQQRFARREPRYSALAHDVWEVPEGQDAGSEEERLFVLGVLATPSEPPRRDIGGTLTILPRSFQARRIADWLCRRLLWPGTRFELRDDLLDPEQLKAIVAQAPPDRLLYSFRRRPPTVAELHAIAERFPLWDHPLELGPAPPSPAPPLLSLHTREPSESVTAAATRLASAAAPGSSPILKLAISIGSLSELLEGHAWASADPQHRAFLPRSDAQPGRWTWYRLLTAASQPLAFFREDQGSSPDQPSLAAFLLATAPEIRRAASQRFAAVLGDPVRHSRTPIEHSAFFRTRGLPVLAVALSESDWDAGGLAALTHLGLRYAAVTAPLKSRAAAAIGLTGSGDAVNTLFYDGQARRWLGTNTDLAGAQELLKQLGSQSQVAIWGGGGTLPALTQAMPQARVFSARTGHERAAPDTTSSWQPHAVIWAVGRERLNRWPPESWRPQLVIDANYSEDSPGREYALTTGARYLAGDAWFKRQAAEQRRFWSEVEHPTSNDI